jgi:hypothetical protein
MSLHISRAAERVLLSLKENDKLTPEAVVETAKSPASPLHKYFPWNDKEAAYAHRLEIAKSMIRTIRVVRECSDRGVVRNISVPKFVSDPTDRGAYRTVESVIGRTRIERDVIADMLNEIASAKGHLDRALAVGAALGVADDIREAIAMMVKLALKVKAERKEAA